jgi:putative DNA primase/helicase
MTIKSHLSAAQEAIRQFCAAMDSAGIAIKGDIVGDGVIHRYRPVGDKRGRNGWYVLHLDGIPAGAAGDYKRGIKIKWSAKGVTLLTRAEHQAFAAKARADRERRAESEAATQAKAALRANAIWNNAKPAPDNHPYLARKGVPSFGLRVSDWVKEWVDGDGEVHTKRVPNAVLVPLRDEGGVIWSLQAVLPTGKNALGRDKDFLPGGRKRGLYYDIGKPKDVGGVTTIILCEGYATAASIHVATGALVIVAFDAGNLVHVARIFRAKRPEARIVVAGDNDAWTETPIKNPGAMRATAAAEAVKGIVIIPRFKDVADKPTDFNDLARLEGLKEVKAQLVAAISGQPAAPSEAEQDQIRPITVFQGL